jgi:hypothetical protein
MKTSTLSVFAGLIALAPSLVASVPLFNETISIWSKRALEPTVDAGLEKRAKAQAAPHWVAYWDQWVSGENGPPATSLLKVRTKMSDPHDMILIDPYCILTMRPPVSGLQYIVRV